VLIGPVFTKRVKLNSTAPKLLSTFLFAITMH
jgi:hypothetical protein